MANIDYKDKNNYTKTRLRNRKYLTSAHIKYIAMFTMFLSHLAQTGFLYDLGPDYWTMADIFVFLGRISMPIFCFFTVQAVIYTSNIKKYFMRMFIFALISEIPFDLAIHENLFYTDSQNVIFTLLIGALAIYFIDLLLKRDINLFIRIIGIILISVLFMLLASILQTDYEFMGVLAIILIYLAKDSKFLTALAIIIGFAFEFAIGGYRIAVSYGFVYLSVPLIMLYNGQRGKQNKWAFYIFYPAHLLIIYFLKLLFI